MAALWPEVVAMTDDRKALGKRGEDAAAAFLERVGMTVVERNWRCQAGEVDIVALDGPTIVLCEVKTRRSASKGSPEEAVTTAKRRRYAKLAAAYLHHVGDECSSLRFDVITLLVIADDRALLRHLRAAFIPES